LTGTLWEKEDKNKKGGGDKKKKGPRRQSKKTHVGRRKLDKGRSDEEKKTKGKPIFIHLRSTREIRIRGMGPGSQSIDREKGKLYHQAEINRKIKGRSRPPPSTGRSSLIELEKGKRAGGPSRRRRVQALHKPPQKRKKKDLKKGEKKKVWSCPQPRI